jgi:hypothetical protein
MPKCVQFLTFSDNYLKASEDLAAMQQQEGYLGGRVVTHWDKYMAQCFFKYDGTEDAGYKMSHDVMVVLLPASLATACGIRI